MKWDVLSDDCGGQKKASQSWLGAERKLDWLLGSSVQSQAAAREAGVSGWRGQLGLLTWVPDQPCALGKSVFLCNMSFTP